jgi:putative acetyltransferase
MVDLFAAVADEGRWLGRESPVDTDELRRRWTRRLADTGDPDADDPDADDPDADDTRDPDTGDPDSGDRGVHLVAEAGGAVVGQASIDLAPYGVASLGMLVDGAWRRRGVGQALVRAAVEAARDHGCHKVSLQVWPHNEAARALYRKAGFVEEGRLLRHYRRRNGELWDAVVMGLVLDETAPGFSAGTAG